MTVLPIEIAKARNVLLVLADAEPKRELAEIFRIVAAHLYLQLVEIALDTREIEAGRILIN